MEILYSRGYAIVIKIACRDEGKRSRTVRVGCMVYVKNATAAGRRRRLGPQGVHRWDFQIGSLSHVCPI